MAKREVRVNLRRALVSVVIVVVIAALAFLLLARANLSKMLNALRGANYLFVGLAVGVYVFSIALWATRWRIALSAMGHNVDLCPLFLAVWGSVFVNNVTPFTYSGGDPLARTYLLKKITKTPYSSGFAAIVAEFLLDLPVFLSFIAFGLMFSLGRIPALPALFLLALWLAVLIVLVPLLPRLLRARAAAGKISSVVWRAARLLQVRTTKAKISRSVGLFYWGTYRVVCKRRRALSMVLIAAILWSFLMLRFYLIFQALGYPPPMPMLMLVATLPTIVGLIPLLPGGLGTVDVAYLSIFTVFGVPLSLALSAVLIERAITYVLGTLIGAGALSYLGIQLWTKKK
ncbi:MAG: flippase-like domain-containing protein [Candidatus Hodarchaeaceae archaeon]|nr:flippase-like domain-containing protein [Candidatus Hodarchaeaceae archaeon]